MLLIKNGLTLEVLIQKVGFINFVYADVTVRFNGWYIGVLLRYVAF